LGDPFTVTVSVKPEPRGFNDVKTICSNTGTLGYNLQTSNVNVTASGGNSLASSFQWVAASNTNVGGETSSAPVSGNTITDNLTNTTGVDQIVVYTITPTGTVGGCQGDNFTLRVTVNPEPVGVSNSEIICSDVALGSGMTLTTNGTSVSAASYNINTITFSSGSLTASAGNPVSGGSGLGKTANELIDDAWTNQTGSSVDVIYNVSPVSSAGCVGSTVHGDGDG